MTFLVRLGIIVLVGVVIHLLVSSCIHEYVIKSLQDRINKLEYDLSNLDTKNK